MRCENGRMTESNPSGSISKFRNLSSPSVPWRSDIPNPFVNDDEQSLQYAQIVLTAHLRSNYILTRRKRIQQHDFERTQNETQAYYWSSDPPLLSLDSSPRGPFGRCIDNRSKSSNCKGNNPFRTLVPFSHRPALREKWQREG